MDDINVYICPKCGYVYIIETIDDIKPKHICHQCGYECMIKAPTFGKRITKSVAEIFRIKGYEFQWIYDGIDVTLYYTIQFVMTGAVKRVSEAMPKYVETLNESVTKPFGKASCKEMEDGKSFNVTYIRKGIKQSKYWDTDRYEKEGSIEAESILDSIGSSMVVFLRMMNTLNKI